MIGSGWRESISVSRPPVIPAEKKIRIVLAVLSGVSIALPAVNDD